MEVVLEIVKTCIPIIVGALIAIIPTMIEKSSERRHEFVEKRCQQKQEMYVELISLFSKVLKNQCDSVDLDTLRDRINLISITGSADVVRAMNPYKHMTNPADFLHQVIHFHIKAILLSAVFYQMDHSPPTFHIHDRPIWDLV